VCVCIYIYMYVCIYIYMYKRCPLLKTAYIKFQGQITYAPAKWPQIFRWGSIHSYFQKFYAIFGTFAELLKATVSFIISVLPSVLVSFCLSVRMGKLESNWKDFQESLYLRIFRNSLHRIQYWLKYGKKNGRFPWTPIYIFITSRSVFLVMRNISEKVFRKKGK
jgi:hypothetical protein